jgi:hypothetical protein
MLTICFAIAKSSSSFFSSKMTKKRSNLDMIGGEISTFHLRDLVLSYLPLRGLAAAKIDDLAFKVAWMPALAIEIVYCSIAS